MFECDELSPSVYCSAVLKSQPEGRRGRYSQLMWFTLETCESIADLVCYFLSSVVQDSANQPVLLLAGLSILTHTVHSHTHTRTHAHTRLITVNLPCVLFVSLKKEKYVTFHLNLLFLLPYCHFHAPVLRQSQNALGRCTEDV